ncbi:MAG TPA: ATP-binding protein [Mycobacteriales bacterium]|nr:ATP-binding protein [Mycobacteriales bacterium]
MAPAVPFALLGVVQLTAVAAWLALAGASLFPRLRRRVTFLFVAGALAMAVADALTALRFGDVSSDAIGWLRFVGLVLIALGALGGSGQSLVLPVPAGLAGVVVPLGARPSAAVAGGAAALVGAVAAGWRGARAGADRALGLLLATALLFTGVAATLAAQADTSLDAAVVLLAARGLATLFLIGALVQIARGMLLGKIVGAIVAGVVAMAAGAVGVVGTGVANQVQSEQSQRLLQVAGGEQESLTGLATRSGLFAQVVAQCPKQPQYCAGFLKLFSEQPAYFAVLVRRGAGATVIAPDARAVSNAGLLQLAGSQIVQQVLKPGTLPSTASSGPLLLSGGAGKPPVLALVAAAPGRPDGSNDARVRPTFAAVYGAGVVDAYLQQLQRGTGYDVSVIADGQVIASSLRTALARRTVLSEARSAGVETADVSVQKVVAAQGDAPTAALVPITEAGNEDVRIATLALSQPANEALAAQRSVLQRLFLTALAALLVVALFAIALAQRISDPVRRLTIAAGRVRRGDLEATTTVSSRDEVGRLSRAFDAMTSSLRALTADLRATAEQEATLRARLERVVESMTDGLVVTDGAGVVTDVNPMALVLLGGDERDIVGKPLQDVVRVEDGEGRSLLERALAGAGTVDGELIGGGESRVPVRFGVESLADGQGRVVVLADRRREREIERMKTEFLANVSHELRTPLTPIRGYAEMIARRPNLTREQVEMFVDEILASTSRMSRAVELLVDVAALEAGRVHGDRGPVTVRTYVDERVETWRERYPERADDIKRRIAGKLPTVDIDRHWVGRALDELVDNAVKYTPARTPITIVATMAEDGTPRVRVGVRDAGPGFDPAMSAELVGDFSQADASETRRVGGLGLGLGFVSRVVDRFGLQMLIDSEPGKGSEFSLLLPAAGPAASPPKPRSARAKASAAGPL